MIGWQPIAEAAIFRSVKNLGTTVSWTAGDRAIAPEPVFVAAPAQGIAHLRLQAFLDDQTRRQSNQLALRAVNAKPARHQLFQGFTHPL